MSNPYKILQTTAEIQLVARLSGEGLTIEGNIKFPNEKLLLSSLQDLINLRFEEIGGVNEKLADSAKEEALRLITEGKDAASKKYKR
jgi:hypothetical protein